MLPYYFFMVVAKLIPVRWGRPRFVHWAQYRFSLSYALSEHLKAIESLVYYHTHLFKAPTIMTVDATLDALIGGCSIARFGDGELELMVKEEGRMVFQQFQKPDAKLARRLREVLASDEPRLLIGIFRNTYELEDLTDYSRAFWAKASGWMHAAQARYLRPAKTYAATEVSLAYQIYRAFDVATYFDKARRIWEGKDVVLIHGDGIFDRLSHDIFDNARSVEHILAPRRDAFDRYDEILARAFAGAEGPSDDCDLGPDGDRLGP